MSYLTFNALTWSPYPTKSLLHAMNFMLLLYQAGKVAGKQPVASSFNAFV